MNGEGYSDEEFYAEENTNSDDYDMSMEEIVERIKKNNKITELGKKDTNAQDLRTQVLTHSVQMIEELQTIFYGKKELKANQAQAYEMLWPVITEIVSKTEDLKVMEAKNAKEVLTAVQKGKMTMSEASAMMALLKDQVTIDELPKLLAALQENEGK